MSLILVCKGGQERRTRSERVEEKRRGEQEWKRRDEQDSFLYLCMFLFIIDLAKEIISNMSEYGIYTLIDDHQDVFSEKFCGEGKCPSLYLLSSLPLTLFSES